MPTLIHGWPGQGLTRAMGRDQEGVMTYAISIYSFSGQYWRSRFSAR